jgi:hypothetical protein
MDKLLEIALWPPYLAIRATHWVLWQTLDTIEYVRRG